jgi:two-component system copper resistance phosphate regulon response regulator CusR
LRILIVEDELETARMLAKGLREHTYAVDAAGDGDEAIYKAKVNDYDLILLDVMLPGRDGFAVCRELRAAGMITPVLILTARDAVADRVAGLDTGADDYLIKPFALTELLARMRALLRRGKALTPETVKVGDLIVEPLPRRAWRSGAIIDLTGKEFALLYYLARHQDRVIGRAEIAEHIWDESYDPFSNLIEVYIQRLRRKIDDGHQRKLLQTRRGEGYMLSAGATAEDV